MYRVCIDDFADFAVNAFGCTYEEALSFIEAEYTFLRRICFVGEKMLEARDGYLEEVYYTPICYNDCVNLEELKLYVSRSTGIPRRRVERLMREENNYLLSQ